ncbi:hypothetical protein E0K89_016965 [Aquicoccus sp. SCR17]|nr:hypothetical protein [Carideicomes alvinocaridis]
MTSRLFAILPLLFLPLAASAGEARLVSAVASHPAMGWRFDVTVEHDDTGWEHYVDGWEVVDAEGNRLGYRDLAHPHLHEQPFTRSLTGVMLPDGTREVFIRIHCSDKGWSEKRYRIELEPEDW